MSDLGTIVDSGDVTIQRDKEDPSWLAVTIKDRFGMYETFDIDIDTANVLASALQDAIMIPRG